MTKEELEDENRTLRWAVNPNILERMICAGEIEVGDGIPHWGDYKSTDPAKRAGVDRLLDNIQRGNAKPSERFKKWITLYEMVKKLEE